MAKCYSHNGEDYRYSADEFAQAATDMCDDFENGEIVEIYEGEEVEKSASTYIPCINNLIEQVQENAWEDLGEFSAGWLDDVTTEQTKDLENMLESMLDKWATKHELQPRFFGVTALGTIKLKSLTDKDGGADYKVIGIKT